MRAPAWAGEREKKVLQAGDDAGERLDMIEISKRSQNNRSNWRCVKDMYKKRSMNGTAIPILKSYLHCTYVSRCGMDVCRCRL